MKLEDLRRDDIGNVVAVIQKKDALAANSIRPLLTFQEYCGTAF
jgi:hypothetical protein